MELIDQNAAETSIKVFLDLKISGDISQADHMDNIKRHVRKFLSEEFRLNGKTMNDQTMRIVATKRARELMAITFVIGNLPQGMDGINNGIVRGILLLTLKELTDFDWDDAVTTIKKYEKKNGIFENRKPTGAANMALAKQKQPKKPTDKPKNTQRTSITWAERKLQPDLDPKELEKNKKKMETAHNQLQQCNLTHKQ